MRKSIYDQLPALRSRISFAPLLRLWKEISEGEQGVAAMLCARMHQRFRRIPDLMEPTTDYGILDQHKGLIEEAMLTLFPLALNTQEDLYSVAMPFSSKPIYASSFFRKTYLNDGGGYSKAMDPQVEKNVAVAKINLAYKLILKKWYDIELVGGNAIISAYPERELNIHNYFELEWDPQFIDIIALSELPALPEEFGLKCQHVRDLIRYPELQDLLPLERFIFEGFVITHIREVSERETVNTIQSILEREGGLQDEQNLPELQQQIRYLLQLEDAEIGFTSFYDAEDEVELPLINFASALLQNVGSGDEIISFCHYLSEELQRHPNYFWWRQANRAGSNRLEALLEKEGWKSALITALFHNQKIIGCLEVLTRDGMSVGKHTLTRVEYARDLLQAALRENRQQVQGRINDLVKEHFTAVQSSVEWKFSNAAIRFLLHQHQGKPEKIASVVFEDVHPLYGAIDIRNSSGERNRAVQQDLQQQLTAARHIIEKAQASLDYPLMAEIHAYIEKYLGSVATTLLATDEQLIQHFLRSDVHELIQYLRDAALDCRDEIDAYLNAASPHQNLFSEHRQEFEDSVTIINNQVAQYLDAEQEHLQKMFPHYFERFVTDGVDFNIYIGQSIAPAVSFSTVHLHNLRLWQLSAMASIAQKIQRSTVILPLALQTTQLVLAYSEPISIRFRNAERKFDVDGVHHAQYEIIKKRIDKAKVKGTGERVTKPGTIAIVYSGEDEGNEYRQYAEYLKDEGLLTGEADELDIEDLQSISGLKALRVYVQMEAGKANLKQQLTAEFGGSA